MDEIITVAGSHLRGFRGAPGESRLRPRIVPKDCTTRYFMRCRDDGYVMGVVVQNPIGEIVCFTTGAGGSEHRWGCKDPGNGIIEFYPHPQYEHTRICKECEGSGLIGLTPTAPWGTRCKNCEGEGRIPAPVCLVFERHVVAERIYIEPTTQFFFPEV